MLPAGQYDQETTGNKYEIAVKVSKAQYLEVRVITIGTNGANTSRNCHNFKSYLRAVDEVVHQSHEKWFHPLHFPGKYRSQLLEAQDRDKGVAADDAFSGFSNIEWLAPP